MTKPSSNRPLSALPAGRREEARESRKRQIVEAAHTLIGARDDGKFSRQELAQHSGVSLATPYNLFGSKAAVLGAVFERQIRSSQKRHSRLEGGTVGARLSAAIDQLIVPFDDDARFYRNFWQALSALSPTEHRELIVPISEELLRPLVRNLVEDQFIDASVPDEVVATTLVRVFDASFELWASQDWTASQLRSQLISSFSLCILGLVTERDRCDLLKIIRQEQSGCRLRCGRLAGIHGRPGWHAGNASCL